MAKADKTAGPVSRVFGRQVRAARELRGLSQAKLSRRLKDAGVDLAQVTVARIENGDRRISVDDALALAVALGVNPLYLFSGDFTNEAVPVTPTLGEIVPSQMRFWFNGTLPLPGTDERSFFALIPDEELIARQKRGLQHLWASVEHFTRAVIDKDGREQAYALRLIRTEIDRQQEGLELEESRARKEGDDAKS